MKIILLACLIGISFADYPVSSYSSLPYETEGYGSGYQSNSIQGHYGYGPSQTSTYTTGKTKGKKFGFDLGHIVYTPIRLAKGAGNYVHGLLGDIKGKYLQMTGSLARAKGGFLTGIGENLIEKGNSYRIGKEEPAGYYYQEVSPEYIPSAPSSSYGAPSSSYGAPSTSYGAPSGKHAAIAHGTHGKNHGIKNHGAEGHHGTTTHIRDASPHTHSAPASSYATPTQTFSGTHEVHNHANSHTEDNNFGSPKDTDILQQHEQYQEASSINEYQAPSQAATGRVGQHLEFISSQRIYHEDPQPIPVPVSVPIAPMKLVMPQLPR